MATTKWSAKEIADDEQLISRVEASDIRQCTHCGMYVMVEEYGNEQPLNDGRVVYDCCDDCKELIEQGKEVIYEEECTYEDYIEEENEEE